MGHGGQGGGAFAKVGVLFHLLYLNMDVPFPSRMVTLSLERGASLSPRGRLVLKHTSWPQVRCTQHGHDERPLVWKNRGSTQCLHIIDDCSDYLSHFLCCLACRPQRMPSTTLPSLLRTVAQASGIIDGWEYHETICQNKWDRRHIGGRVVSGKESHKQTNCS